MKIELMDILYTSSMLILAVIGALVITKTISRFVSKEEEDEEKE
jgi:hypothetical protein